LTAIIHLSAKSTTRTVAKIILLVEHTHMPALILGDRVCDEQFSRIWSKRNLLQGFYLDRKESPPASLLLAGLALGQP